jgi:ribosomal protein L5
VDWDVAISYQFLKCLNVTLSTSLKYYNGVKIEKFDKAGNSLGATERVQFKSILGLGVGYSF